METRVILQCAAKTNRTPIVDLEGPCSIHLSYSDNNGMAVRVVAICALMAIPSFHLQVKQPADIPHSLGGRNTPLSHMPPIANVLLLCAGDRTRTCNPLLTRQQLYH